MKQALCSLAVSVLSIGAQASCLNTVSTFAEEQCGVIQDGGFIKTIEAEIQGNAESARLLKLLGAKLEGKGGFKYLDEKFNGVGRGDLKEERANVRSCKIEIVNLIYASECKK